MKSTCSIKIEVDDVHLLTSQSDESSPNDTPSIAVPNYIIQHYNILHEYLLIDTLLLAYGRFVTQPTSTDKEASPLPTGGNDSLLNLPQQLPIDPLLPAYVRVVTQLMLLNQIYSYFGDFS